MQTVKWKELQFSYAPNCDQCNKPFIDREVRLLGDFGNGGQAIVHQCCKSHWENRTGIIDVEQLPRFQKG